MAVHIVVSSLRKEENMSDKLYELMNWRDIEEIVYSECSHPERLLGPHKVEDQFLIQAFVPGAVSLVLQYLDGTKQVDMEQQDEEGYFACLVSEKAMPLYEYDATYPDGERMTVPECYRFETEMTTEEIGTFERGKCTCSEKLLGAQLTKRDGLSGIRFRVYAPHALRVSVVGDFNRFDGRMHQMCGVEDSGFYELFIPGLAEGISYQYEIKDRHGVCYLKADPYARKQTFGGRCLSEVVKEKSYKWADKLFMEERKKSAKALKAPCYYEMHLNAFFGQGKAGFKKHADALVENIKSKGYTHVLFMPMMEYPADQSFGYETLGYFALSSRFGASNDVKYVIDAFHKAGIFVMMDYTPARFPMEECGLRYFDGACLYEASDERRRYQADGRSFKYYYGEPAVTNMLLSAACFWIEKYHLDGIRLNALDTMLYTNYDREDWNSARNIYGGFEDLEAVAFVRELVRTVHEKFTGVSVWAQDSYAWPNITAEENENGLGIDLVTKSKKETWIFDGKEEAFHSDALKIYYAYRMLKPGTKLFSAFEEQNAYSDAFVEELIKLYQKNDAFSDKGELIYQSSDQSGNGLDAFVRKGKNAFLVLINHSVRALDACVKVDCQGTYKPVLDSSDVRFGGQEKGTSKVLDGMPDDRLDESNEEAFYLHVSVPACSLIVYRYAPFTKEDVNRIMKLRLEIKQQALQEKLQALDDQLAQIKAERDRIQEKYDKVAEEMNALG